MSMTSCMGDREVKKKDFWALSWSLFILFTRNHWTKLLTVKAISSLLRQADARRVISELCELRLTLFKCYELMRVMSYDLNSVLRVQLRTVWQHGSNVFCCSFRLGICCWVCWRVLLPAFEVKSFIMKWKEMWEILLSVKTYRMSDGFLWVSLRNTHKVLNFTHS